MDFILSPHDTQILRGLQFALMLAKFSWGVHGYSPKPGEIARQLSQLKNHGMNGGNPSRYFLKIQGPIT